VSYLADFLQAALTKLSYLLSKSELSTADVRKLMEMPLRGELTVPVGLSASVPSGLDGVQSVMAHLLRLSTNTPASATYSSFGVIQIEASPSQSLTERAKDITASWSLTASDAASTAIAILPYLIHLAASKDDIHALKFCIDAADAAAADANIEAKSLSGDPVSAIIGRGGAAGIVNALDTARRAPLHTAALRGSVACTKVLLESGASVHLRDSLDHTSLYYVSVMSTLHPGASDTSRVLLTLPGCSTRTR
jgi:60kDa lysophospholipase